MTCFNCNTGKFDRRWVPVEGKIKRKKYTVNAWALVCDHCGHISMEGADVQEFMRSLADSYRTDNKLLTSSEIRAIRGGLSQARFAQELGVGVASVKRWELGLVQDRSSDRLIRTYARSLEPSWAYELPAAAAPPLAVACWVGLAHGPPLSKY
jgi:putative zinc finger/helix-turn-helix YgiT family protein